MNSCTAGGLINHKPLVVVRQFDNFYEPCENTHPSRQQLPTDIFAQVVEDRWATGFNAALPTTRSPDCWVYHITETSGSHLKSLLGLALTGVAQLVGHPPTN